MAANPSIADSVLDTERTVNPRYAAIAAEYGVALRTTWAGTLLVDINVHKPYGTLAASLALEANNCIYINFRTERIPLWQTTVERCGVWTLLSINLDLCDYTGQWWFRTTALDALEAIRDERVKEVQA